MTDLIVDVSPLAINRTAMYFVVRDTVRHLVDSGNPVRLDAMGGGVDLAEFIANDYALNARLESRVGGLIDRALATPEAFANQRERKTRLEKPCIRLVFDPLYLLFANPASRTVCYVLDLTPITRPEWHRSSVSRLYTFAFDRLYDPSIDILAISKSTARDLWANYGIPRSRVSVIPLYDRFDRSPEERPRQPEKRFLFVGSLETRKNITGLVEGFSLSGLSKQGYTLRIVGGDGHGADVIKSAVAHVPGTILCGRLSDEELRGEYERCCALAYPSLWEGYGLPALEALSRGVPLILSDTGALPEVGGPFARYVDPCNPRSIANVLIETARETATDLLEGSEATEARKQWLHQFSREAYLSSVSGAIRRAESEVAQPTFEGLSPPGGTSSATSSSPNDGASKGSYSLTRRVRRALIHRSRILPATLHDVPGNSFSMDYLYCVQQERRLRLSRMLARFMSGRLWMYPWYTVRVIITTISLQITNALTRAMINEILLQKLSARLDKKNE